MVFCDMDSKMRVDYPAILHPEESVLQGGIDTGPVIGFGHPNRKAHIVKTSNILRIDFILFLLILEYNAV